MDGPRMFVVAGTLVPDTGWLGRLIPPAVHEPIRQLDSLQLLPLAPGRVLSDLLYMPVKRECSTWVVALPRLGLVSQEQSYAVVKQAFLEAVEAAGGRPIVVKGQSQGGLYALMLGLDADTQQYVAAVQADGTPLAGTEVIEHRLLRWSKIFPGVRAMLPGSEELTDLHERIRVDWQRSVPVAVVASPHDELVRPWKSALSIKLPRGAHLRKYVVAPARPSGIHHTVIHIPSAHRISHLAMEWERVVLDLTCDFHGLHRPHLAVHPALTLRRQEAA